MQLAAVSRSARRQIVEASALVGDHSRAKADEFEDVIAHAAQHGNSVCKARPRARLDRT